VKSFVVTKDTQYIEYLASLYQIKIFDFEAIMDGDFSFSNREK